MRFILKVREGEGYAELRADLDPTMTVLDALETLRAAVEDGAERDAGRPAVGRDVPTARVPHYRHSCHHGSCGTCGALLNGLESLMCLSRLGELAAPRPRTPGAAPEPPELAADGAVIVRIDPIRRGAIIGGVAARPTEALRSIPEWLGYLRPAESVGKAELERDPTREAGGEDPSGGGPGRVRFEACIECGLCSSSCPVCVPFMGPAALAALNRGRERAHARADELLELAGAPDGAAACERHLACSRVCPQAVYPGKHIQLLKNSLATLKR